MDLSPEQLEAIGKMAVPIATALLTAFATLVTGVLAFLQTRCRRDLNAATHELDVAHAMLRSRDSGKPWVSEMRHKPRARRKEDARSSPKDDLRNAGEGPRPTDLDPDIEGGSEG